MDDNNLGPNQNNNDSNDNNDNNDNNKSLSELNKANRILLLIKIVVIVVLIIWLVVFASFLAEYNISYFNNFNYIFNYLDFIYAICLVIAGFGIFLIIRRQRDLSMKIEKIKAKIELNNINYDSIETQSEKLFKLNQEKLDKYNSKVIQRGTEVLRLALLPFFTGSFILSASIYLIFIGASDNTEILAGLGALGATISYLLAAMYLKRFSEASGLSMKFIDLNATTNKLLFSNFISSKIKNEDLRERTLSEIASNSSKPATIKNDSRSRLE